MWIHLMQMKYASNAYTHEEEKKHKQAALSAVWA